VQFPYPCPGCRTTNNLHDPDCEFAGRPHHEVEKAYTDLVAVLSDGPLAREDLPRAIHGEWSDLHAAALSTLRGTDRVDETGGDLLELPPPEERR